MTENEKELLELIKENGNYFNFLANKKLSKDFRYNIIRLFPYLISRFKDSDINFKMEKKVYSCIPNINVLIMINHPSKEFLEFYIKENNFLPYLFEKKGVLTNEKKEYLFKMFKEDPIIYKKVLKELLELENFKKFCNAFLKYNKISEDKEKVIIKILKDFKKVKPNFHCDTYKILFEIPPKYFDIKLFLILLKYIKFRTNNDINLLFNKKVREIIDSPDNPITFKTLKRISPVAYFLALNKEELFDYIYNKILNDNFYLNLDVFIHNVKKLDIILTDIFSIKETELILEKFLKYYDEEKMKELNSRCEDKFYIFVAFFNYNKLIKINSKKFINKYFRILFWSRINKSINKGLIFNFYNELNFFSINTERFYKIFRNVDIEKIFKFQLLIDNSFSSVNLDECLSYFYLNYFLDKKNSIRNKNKMLNKMYNYLEKKQDNLNTHEIVSIKNIVYRFGSSSSKLLLDLKVSVKFVNLLTKIFIENEKFFNKYVLPILIPSIDPNKFDEYDHNLCKILVKKQDIFKIKFKKEIKQSKKYKISLLETKL